MGMWYEVPFVNLRSRDITSELVHILPETFARKHELLPVEEDKSKIVIATSSPDDVITRSLLEKYLRKEVKFVYGTAKDISAHMYLYKKDPQETFNSILERPLDESATMDTRIIDLVNEIINHGYQGSASDIHIEPEEDYVAIRFRQDGVLHDVAQLDVKYHEQIMTRLN